jgi:hypothetical protein
MVLESNFDEISSAAKLAKEIGCDYFEIKPEYNMEHYLINQDASLIESLTGQMADITKMESDGFSILLAENLKTVANGLPLTQPKDYDRCAVSELRTLVTSRGAYICPYHRGNDEAKYGDPTVTSFADLWHGRLRQDVVSKIKPSSHCQFHCIRDRSNQELLQIARSGVIPTPASMANPEDLFI